MSFFESNPIGFNVVVTVTLVSLSNFARNLTPASPIVLKLTPEIWAHLKGIRYVALLAFPIETSILYANFNPSP